MRVDLSTLAAALLLLLATTAATAATPATPVATATTSGTLARDEAMRAQPKADAARVASLGAGTSVEIIERSAGWYRVRHGGKEGWLRLYWVRTGATRARPAGQPLRDIAAGAERLRAPQGQVAAGLGVRGLSEAELGAARFDAAQLAKLEEIARTTQVDNAGFARAGQLQARQVAELVAVQPEKRR